MLPSHYRTELLLLSQNKNWMLSGTALRAGFIAAFFTIFLWLQKQESYVTVCCHASLLASQKQKKTLQYRHLNAWIALNRKDRWTWTLNCLAYLCNPNTSPSHSPADLTSDNGLPRSSHPPPLSVPGGSHRKGIRRQEVPALRSQESWWVAQPSTAHYAKDSSHAAQKNSKQLDFLLEPTAPDSCRPTHLCAVSHVLRLYLAFLVQNEHFKSVPVKSH